MIQKSIGHPPFRLEDQSRYWSMSPPSSTIRSNSSAVITSGFVECALTASSLSYRDQPDFVTWVRKHSKPQFLVLLSDHRRARLIKIPRRKDDAPWIVPECLGLFEIDPVLLRVGMALGRVVSKFHLQVKRRPKSLTNRVKRMPFLSWRLMVRSRHNRLPEVCAYPRHPGYLRRGAGSEKVLG